ncbi:MAG: response regulator [Eubacteriales bacterium]|nr:response regulator [Eubacteriales bacterium]
MRKILIIDDNPKIADFIKRSVNWDSLGCYVRDVFFSPVSALELLDKEKADIIITDVKMPELSGLELSKKILEKQPQTKIILISGFAEIHDVQDAIRLGAFDFIEKPISIDYLQTIIAKAVMRLKEEEEINEQLKERKAMLLDNFFESLLERPFSDDEIKKYSSFFNIKTDNKIYICIHLSYEDQQNLIPRINIENRQRELIKLDNKLSKLYPENDIYYSIKKLSSTTSIIGISKSQKPDNWTKTTSHIISLLDVPENENIIIGIGKPVNNLGEIYFSYKSARDAMEYRFIYPNDRVFDYQSINSKNYSDFYVGNQSEELISLICKNEKDGLSKFIRTFYYEFARKNTDKITIILAIIDTARNTIEFAKKNGCAENLMIKQIPQIDKVSTLDDFINWLEEICLQICELFNKDMQSYHKMLSSKVDSFISDNYKKCDLRITDIAEYVGVTSNYLSSLYKKLTGINITDAIVDRRITVASDLLARTDKPIKDISEEVGFSNQYYFSSTFKKNTGMTPSEYRNEIK